MPRGQRRLSGTEPTPDAAGDAVEARLLSRMTADFLLRTVAELTPLFGGDVSLMLVFMTVAMSTIADPVSAGQAWTFQGDGVVPDNLRRPVSTMAVANALNMPRETVRRYIKRLVEMGYCAVGEDRRVIMTAEILRRPEVAQVVARNRQNLMRLFTSVHREAPDVLARSRTGER